MNELNKQDKVFIDPEWMKILDRIIQENQNLFKEELANNNEKSVIS